MSNRRIIFWLLVATLTLISADVFLSWRQPSTGAAARQFLLDPAFEARAVTLARPGTPATVLTRGDGAWRLVSPYAGTVDARTILRLLDAFSFAAADDALSAAELFRLGRTRADFGLAEPRLTLSSDFPADVDQNVEAIGLSQKDVYWFGQKGADEKKAGDAPATNTAGSEEDAEKPADKKVAMAR